MAEGPRAGDAPDAAADPAGGGLADLQRDALVGALAESLVHWLNNPLTLLRANLRFLADGLDAGEASGPLADEGAERMGELLGALADVEYVVHALGAYAQARSTAPGPVDLLDVVDLAYALVSVKVRYAADLELLGPDEPVVVPGNAPRLQQLVSSLLLHAEARRAGFGALQARVEATGEAATLTLADSRPPREPDAARPEPAADPRLHLEVAHHIAREHGGELRVDTDPDGRVTYTLALPLADRESPGAPAGGRPGADRE